MSSPGEPTSTKPFTSWAWRRPPGLVPATPTRSSVDPACERLEAREGLTAEVASRWGEIGG